MMENKIKELIKQFFENRKENFVPGETKIGVGAPIYDHKEVINVLDSLLTGWISQGKKVSLFEDNFAEYHETKYAVAVNSGSSANLLALEAMLQSGDISKGGEVIIPATTFPTVATPILQLGLIPHFVDINKEDYNPNTNEVKKAINQKTQVLMPAHFLGAPADMDKLIAIAKENSLKILEDCGEAHGAEYKGKKVGSFGDLATFSFFVAHNMTTGEGGMITTNNPKYYNLLRSLRAFGRACTCKSCANDNGKPCIFGRDTFDDSILKNYDRRQIFLRLGYSMKMTDILAAFGIEQLKKLDAFNVTRRENAEFYSDHLQKYEKFLKLPSKDPNIKHVYYGYPIVIKIDAPFSRKNLTDHLESYKIETRPFFGGNLPDQPAFRDKPIKIQGDLPVAKWLRDFGFFIGSHPGIGDEERRYVIEKFDEFFSKL